MVDAISIIATGASASVMVEGRDEDEWRKRLTAKHHQRYEREEYPSSHVSDR